MQSVVAYWSGCRQKINGLLKPSNGGELSKRTAYRGVWKEGKVKVNEQEMVKHNRTKNSRKMSPL